MNCVRSCYMKIFHFRSLLTKLPDKGENVKKFYEKIEKELKARTDIDEAAKLFSKLNVAEFGKTVVNRMEWNGALANDSDSNVPVLDSDDEEDTNPLKILANKVINKHKIIKIDKVEESLITNEDIDEINSFNHEMQYSANYKQNHNLNSNKFEHLRQRIISNKQNEEVVIPTNFEPHTEYVCNKESTVPQKNKFKPYHTTINNTLDPEKEKLRFKHKNWENTAATPPTFLHHAAQIIPLHEAITMEMKQQNQQTTRKRIIAAERLVNRKKIINVVKTDTTSYRNPVVFNEISDDSSGTDDSSLTIDSDDEVQDCEPETGVAAVNFITM